MVVPLLVRLSTTTLSPSSSPHFCVLAVHTSPGRREEPRHATARREGIIPHGGVRAGRPRSSPSRATRNASVPEEGSGDGGYAHPQGGVFDLEVSEDKTLFLGNGTRNSMVMSKEVNRFTTCISWLECKGKTRFLGCSLDQRVPFRIPTPGRSSAPPGSGRRTQAT